MSEQGLFQQNQAAFYFKATLHTWSPAASDLCRARAHQTIQQQQQWSQVMHLMAGKARSVTGKVKLVAVQRLVTLPVQLLANQHRCMGKKLTALYQGRAVACSPRLEATTHSPQLRAATCSPKLRATTCSPKLRATTHSPKLEATTLSLKPQVVETTCSDAKSSHRSNHHRIIFSRQLVCILESRLRHFQFLVSHRAA